MTTSTRTTWHLARLADCFDPDAHDGIGFDHAPADRQASPGAIFLRHVEDAYAEALDYARQDDPSATVDDDAFHEIADGAVPIYTAERWRVFTDLGAWQADIEEDYASTDLTELAGIALYVIAETLVRALAEETADDSAHDDETDEDGYGGQAIRAAHVWSAEETAESQDDDGDES